MDERSDFGHTRGVESIPVSAPDELPLGEALLVEGGKWRLEPATNKERWEGDKLPVDDRARLYIIRGVFWVLVVLLASHVVLGFEHIKGVDDVIKLLGPSMSITATILGAALAFYFTQRK